MTTPDLIKALLRPETYPHATNDIRLIETHISWVFLTGLHAYKIKKPMNFGFLDFSTLAKRKHCCEEELRLNRRLAPALYQQVLALTGDAVCPTWNGEGPVLDYAIQMQQFDPAQLLSRLSERGELSDVHIDRLAKHIAEFHQRIEQVDQHTTLGEPETVHRWVAENFTQMLPLVANDQEHARLHLERLQAWSEESYQALYAAFKQRKHDGFIRCCHGDMHLENITLINKELVIFDGIEFNPELIWIDTMGDLAFILMDLIDRKHTTFAQRLLNHYLQITGDYAGLQLLRYYISYRAMVRAKIALLRRAQLQSVDEQAACWQTYQRYVTLAEQISAPKQAAMILMCGFSGSGKSTYAEQLAMHLGAIQLRSDVERKRLFGYQPLDSTASHTGDGIYSIEATQQTYAHLLQLSQSLLAMHYSVIVDAAFLKKSERDAFRQYAKDHKLAFLIIHTNASLATLQKRIVQRQALRQDPSEATLDVLAMQQSAWQAFTEEEKNNVLEVSETDTFSSLLKQVNTLSHPLQLVLKSLINPSI